jgi:NAD(P)-dependent dehydrogenase (short-subunit alcohol dehydrogenase family)
LKPPVETGVPNGLRGKVAVVTGASRGIGREIARALCRAGAQVALLARPSDDLDALADELRGCSSVMPCDLADPGEVRAAFLSVGKAFGRLDILVNNAAICAPYKVADATDSALLRDLSVNLLAPICCAREAIPMLIAAGGGSILNVSSESVRFPVPQLTVYAATKGGLEVFSAALRSELRPLGIRVTTLRCGNVAGTGITQGWGEAQAASFFAEMQSSGAAAETGPGGTPQSVARAVVDILSMPPDVNVDLMELRSM